MAAVLTVTREAPVASKMAVFSVAWTSHTDGTGTSDAIGPITGFLWQIETNPGATAPTDNYDVFIESSNGADLMGGGGADRDTANTEIAYPTTADNSKPHIFNDTFTVRLANAGSAKTGVVRVFVYCK